MHALTDGEDDEKRIYRERISGGDNRLSQGLKIRNGS